MLRFSPLLLLGAVLSVVSLAGCQQRRLNMPVSDFAHYQDQALHCVSPADDPTIDPANYDSSLKRLRTVESPEAPKREISLTECFAIALENGRTGESFDRQLGQRFNLIGAQRLTPASNLTDSMRVFRYDPAIQALDIEQSLAKFDAFWSSSMTWSKVDRPVGTALDTFFAAGRNSIDQDQAQFNTSLQKPLPTGGVAGITLGTEYELSNLNPRVNPSYRPSLSVNVEQPLLNGFGVGINELLTQHPGSVRGAVFPTGGRVPGILLTRIFQQQADVEFQRRVQNLLFTVEEAYWELYSAYWELYSREIALRQAHAAWVKAYALHKAGRTPKQDLDQVEQQFQSFRAQRLQASGNGTTRAGVLEAERRLRYVLGLPLEDGFRIVPSDTPAVAPFEPDAVASFLEALRKRPELIQTRMDIHAAQLSVLRDQNGLYPDIRGFANYELVSLGSKLDGNDENSAFRNLATGNNINWTAGILARVPIGYREAHAEKMRSQLQLLQKVAYLTDQEKKLEFALGRVIRDLKENHTLIRIQRARREAAKSELELRYREFTEGGKTTIDVLLEAQRNWADSLRDEHIAIAAYNISLAEFQRQKGTILEANNVTIAENQDQIPDHVKAQAVRNLRERNGSLKLQECNGDTCVDGKSWEWHLPTLPAFPTLPANQGYLLPGVMQQTDSQPKLPETHTAPPAPPAPKPLTSPINYMNLTPPQQ